MIQNPQTELIDQVSSLSYWKQQKLRVWLRELEGEEPRPDDAALLDLVKKEVAAILPLVPPDDLMRVLQIVRLYACGR